ncbi:MAG: hypothetical protein RBU45_07035 [Myxococcota bacterium]|jgi:hypothetical protein|nr:hypothetical protein [Myxococcota bacterium]
MKKTPLQEVKERFGSKEALVKSVASMIERPAGETEADSISRLTSVPNSKLLHLHQIHTQLQERFGSREKLVDAICALRFGTKKVDQDYRAKLLKASVGTLLDRHGVLAKG